MRKLIKDLFVDEISSDELIYEMICDVWNWLLFPDAYRNIKLSR
jgi:hypothetical protein